MSSTVVRTRFRDQVQLWAAAQLPPVEYVETINTDDQPNGAGGRWVTIGFSLDAVEELTYGRAHEQESGTVTVSVFGAPGKGDAEVLELAESVAAYFRAIKDPLGDGVEVGVVSSPDDFSSPGQVTGSWFGLSVDVDYEAFRTN